MVVICRKSDKIMNPMNAIGTLIELQEIGESIKQGLGEYLTNLTCIFNNGSQL